MLRFGDGNGGDGTYFLGLRPSSEGRQRSPTRFQWKISDEGPSWRRRSKGQKGVSRRPNAWRRRSPRRESKAKDLTEEHIKLLRNCLRFATKGELENLRDTVRM